MTLRFWRKKAEVPEPAAAVLEPVEPGGEVIVLGDAQSSADELPHDAHVEAHLEHLEGLRPPDDGPHGGDDLYRKPLPLWDRVKWLVLLAAIFLVLVWNSMANDPLLPFSDATRLEVDSAWW